jgi:hypothetical protein
VSAAVLYSANGHEKGRSSMFQHFEEDEEPKTIFEDTKHQDSGPNYKKSLCLSQKRRVARVHPLVRPLHENNNIPEHS